MARREKETRMCAGCMRRFNKSELLRISMSKDGIISFGFKNSGRGIYICKNTACMDLAVKKKSFSRSFKTGVDPSVYDEVRSLISSECMEGSS